MSDLFLLIVGAAACGVLFLLAVASIADTVPDEDE